MAITAKVYLVDVAKQPVGEIRRLGIPEDQLDSYSYIAGMITGEGSLALFWRGNPTLFSPLKSIETTTAHLRSLLLLAGDVETNPGPTCSGCSKTIRRDFVPIVCSACQRDFHKKCSGLTRSQQKNPNDFVCRFCSCTGTPDVKCHNCKSKIDSDHTPIVCQTCSNVTHRSCAKTYSYTEWRCCSCISSTTSQPLTASPRNRVTPGKETCPSCHNPLRQCRIPLVCASCCRGFHFKCAPGTRGAVEHLRDSNKWICQTCLPEVRAIRPVVLRASISHLNIVQWNANCLSVKVLELEAFLQRYEIDIALIQETKLGGKDPPPHILGFDEIRKDRIGSGTEHYRGGGLLIYIRKDIQYSVLSSANTTALELQQVNLLDAHGRKISITNAYFPPITSRYAKGQDNHQRWLDCLPKNHGIICGDFNAHHVAWDPSAKVDARGMELHTWAKDNHKAILNNGTTTRAPRNKKSTRESTPDLTLVDVDSANCFSWKPINELSSDHKPLLITWQEDLKVEHLNTRNKGSVSTSRAIPVKAILRRETPRMNPELQEFIKERENSCQQLLQNREAWLAKSKVVPQKTEEAKRDAWPKHLHKISEHKDAKQAWQVVRVLSGKDALNRGKMLVYRGAEFASDHAKANAFIQEYAFISS